MMTNRLSRCHPLTILALLLVSLSQTHAGDWTRFRGSDGSATSTQPAPESWDESKLSWKTKLPGRGASSVIALGDKLYLTAFSGYGMDSDEPGNRDDLRLHVLCLSRRDGKLIWDKSIVASPNEQKMGKRIADHGYATNTPACDASGVYAFFGATGVVAYDHSGNQLWHTEVGSKTAGFGSAASPILFEDLVIVNASIESQSLYALNKKTGKVAWKVDGIVRTWTTPLLVRVDSGPELIVSMKGEIRGYSPKSGELLWNCKGIQDYVVPCPIERDGVVYCLGGRKNQAIAVKAGGRGDVTESHVLWDVNIGANVTSPVLHKGKLYWVSDRGIACCLDASSGEEVYRTRIKARGRIYASVALAGDTIYATTRDRGVLAYKANDEFNVVATNKLGDPEILFNASPTILDGKIYLRTDRYLYCVGK